MGERCKEKKEELLRTHKVKPLEDNVAKELDRIAQGAMKSLG